MFTFLSQMLGEKYFSFLKHTCAKCECITGTFWRNHTRFEELIVCICMFLHMPKFHPLCRWLFVEEGRKKKQQTKTQTK